MRVLGLTLAGLSPVLMVVGPASVAIHQLAKRLQPRNLDSPDGLEGIWRVVYKAYVLQGQKEVYYPFQLAR